MTNILKSNIEEIRKEHGLSKKDIDIFAGNLAISFKGYPLFEYFANDKYNIKKMKKFWKVSLKTMSDKTFFLYDLENNDKIVLETGNKEYIFEKCLSLLKFNIKSSEFFATTSDDLLTNKSGNEMIQYPIGNTRTSYTIPTATSMYSAIKNKCKNSIYNFYIIFLEHKR